MESSPSLPPPAPSPAAASAPAASPRAARRPAAGGRGAPASRQLGLLGLVLVTLALTVAHWVAPGLGSPRAPLHLPWWGLAVAFALSELWAEHVYPRRSAHPFVTGGLALALGLLFAAPPDLAVAQLTGTAAVMAWRQPLRRLPFALGQAAAAGCVALLVYHRLLSSDDVTAHASWAALFGAMAAAGLTACALHALGLRTAGATIDVRAVGRTLGADALVTAATSSVVLGATVLLVVQRDAAWLIGIPALLALVAHRAYLRERDRRERLDFLHETGQALMHAPDVEQALLELLDRARIEFRAGFAEVVLIPTDETAPRRTRLSDLEHHAVRVVEPEDDGILRELTLGDEPLRRVGRPAAPPALERYLAAAGVRGAVMVGVVAGAERPLGLLLVGDRPDAERRFGRRDLELLGRLAATVASGLEHDTLEQDFGRLAQLKGQLEHLAFHDPLTGLANRSRFIEQARHGLARRRARVAALFIDLDDFKTVNDSLGHKAGDELLVAVAERLRACLRAHDTPARLGGDEFAVLIEDAESMEVVLEIAERILEALSQPFDLGGEAEVSVLGSIGIATNDEGVRRAEDLVRNADLAMYRAKSQGKGCIELFESEMHARAVQRHEIKSELARAVADDQLVVHFQPVVDLAGGEIGGVEALVRWQHPRLGLLGPNAFVPIAEESGLIDDIGRIVAEKSFARLAAWRKVSIAGDDFRLSMNISAREFGRADLVRSLCEATERAGVPTSAITLEITESAVMKDLEASIRRMEAIKAAGFRLSLDDFGTGYSSLSHLRKFPIDVLKIAKPFVDHIAERHQDAAFLRSVLDLARTLSLDVIVEGVETAEQARILLELGARRVQGFVFSKPVEERALSLLLTLTPLRGFAEAAAIDPGAGRAGAAGVATRPVGTPSPLAAG